MARERVRGETAKWEPRKRQKAMVKYIETIYELQTHLVHWEMTGVLIVTCVFLHCFQCTLAMWRSRQKKQDSWRQLIKGAHKDKIAARGLTLKISFAPAPPSSNKQEHPLPITSLWKRAACPRRRWKPASKERGNTPKRGAGPIPGPSSPSLPPWNFTRMVLSMYLERSKILSFFFFSLS